MYETWLVAKREFLERVRTRLFVIGTIALPLFLASVVILPQLGGGGSTRTIAIVDEAPSGIAEAFIDVLTAQPESEDGNRYEVERVSGSFEEVADELNRRVLAEEIYGYVVLPPEVLDSNRIVYRAQNVANLRVMSDLRRSVSRGVQAARLQRAGLDGAQVAALIRTVDVDESQVTESGEPGRSAASAFGYAYVVAFLIYFMTIFYGTSVTRSVIEEKSNRISEVLVSSMRAVYLMLGKILGVAAAALAQVAIWVAAVVALVRSPDLLQRFADVPPEALAMFAVPTGAVLLYVAYFLLGFLVYAAIFAALGAAMTSDQEAQSVQMLGMAPLIVPMLFIPVIIGEPLGTAATVLGMIPLTSPVTAPMRIASAPVPAAQTAMSLGLLVVALVLVTWIAGKIYRIGILATGKKASLRDVFQWLRAT
jgi:ABC-2 type transport system permease protein